MSRPRARRALGTATGGLLAGAIIALVAAALYLGDRNRGELALAQTPAAVYAQALAQVAHSTDDDPAAVQQLISRIKREAPQVQLAAVIVEPRSVKYRFLRKRHYLAHSDSARARSALDPRHAADKRIYDLSNRVRRDGELLEVRAEPDQPLIVTAAQPIERDGRHSATAVVVTEPPPPPPGPPAWPLGAGLLLALVFAAVAGAVTPRYRYLVVMGATAGYGYAAALLLARVSAFYSGARAATGPLHAVLESAGIGTRLVTSAAPEFQPAAAWPLSVAAALALGVGLLGMLGVGARIARRLREHRAAYAYILPAALAMLVLVFLPFGYGLALGFFNHAHGTYTFVGLDNFAEILSGGGRPLSHPLNFYFTLGVTVLWTGTNVFLHVAIGLALALVLKDPLLGFKGIYRVLLILPWAVPNYITALIWKGMFHQQYGAVNHVLDSIGIEKVSWFSHFSTAFCANVVTNTWLGFPFMMVVSLGALQSIPREVYEAAEVDGASRWQAFCRITMPLLRPALFPAIILGSIWTFNMFNIIYLVSAGAPGGASDILITEAYRWAFERADRYGLASAYALIILVILLGYTLIANRLSRATEDTY